MEVIRSSVTSVHALTTLRYILEDSWTFLTQVSSKGPNSVGVSFPSPEDGTRSIGPLILSVTNFSTDIMDTVIPNHIISSVMQHLLSITNVLYPHISLISDALIMRYTWIETAS
jgi:hypothetical protein